MSNEKNDPRGNFRQQDAPVATEKKIPSEAERIEAARDALDKSSTRNSFKKGAPDSRKVKGL